MNLPSWDQILHALILVRLGQELGTDSQLARAVYALCQIIIHVFR